MRPCLWLWSNRYHAMITERAVLKMLDVVWCVLAVGIPLAAGSWLLHNVIRGGNDTQSAWFFPICAYSRCAWRRRSSPMVHRAAYTVGNSFHDFTVGFEPYRARFAERATWLSPHGRLGHEVVFTDSRQ